MDVNWLAVTCPAMMLSCHHEEHVPVVCLLTPFRELQLTKEGVLCELVPCPFLSVHQYYAHHPIA